MSGSTSKVSPLRGKSEKARCCDAMRTFRVYDGEGEAQKTADFLVIGLMDEWLKLGSGSISCRFRSMGALGAG